MKPRCSDCRYYETGRRTGGPIKMNLPDACSLRPEVQPDAMYGSWLVKDELPEWCPVATWRIVAKEDKE